jgi:protein-tyrosine phosphatase
MISVLFVCLGNICRSTMAEGIFRQMISESGLEAQLSCDSAGTAAYHIGKDPDHRTLKTLTKYGCGLSHKGRQFTLRDLGTFNYILAMDSNNYTDIIQLAESQKMDYGHVALIRNFDPVKESRDVPDPYWSEIDGFEEVYQILYRTNKEFLKYLRQKHHF